MDTWVECILTEELGEDKTKILLEMLELAKNNKGKKLTDEILKIIKRETNA